MLCAKLSLARGTLAVVLAGLIAAAQADWPNFRGPNHDGISSETGFKKTWSEPLKLLWERELGDSFSSFACVGDKLYTCGTQGGRQVIFCLNADSGDVIWQKPIEDQYRDRMGGDGARATPTVDDGRVYIFGALGTLLCLKADGGATIWKKKYGDRPTWGYSGSVLIEGDMAIVSAGKSNGALAAYNKKTGKRLWKCEDDGAGYATPYPFTHDGTRYIVGFVARSAIIAEAGTGRLVTRIAWKTDYDVNAAAPIYHNGHLFLSSGYRTGCALFKLSKAGAKLEAREVWTSKVFMSKFQSPILHEGNLYASDQNALSCADFMTGERRWRKKRLDGETAKHGTLVLADRHLLLLTARGKLHIGKVDPAGFKPISSAEVLSGRCWTVPVLNNGKLYVRNLATVKCFELKS